MRAWCNGSTIAFQALRGGSSPLARFALGLGSPLCSDGANPASASRLMASEASHPSPDFSLYEKSFFS